jgi:flagellar hook-length control protein FliK
MQATSAIATANAARADSSAQSRSRDSTTQTFGDVLAARQRDDRASGRTDARPVTKRSDPKDSDVADQAEQDSARSKVKAEGTVDAQADDSSAGASTGSGQSSKVVRGHVAKTGRPRKGGAGSVNGADDQTDEQAGAATDPATASIEESAGPDTGLQSTEASDDTDSGAEASVGKGPEEAKAAADGAATVAVGGASSEAVAASVVVPAQGANQPADLVGPAGGSEVAGKQPTPEAKAVSAQGGTSAGVSQLSGETGKSGTNGSARVVGLGRDSAGLNTSDGATNGGDAGSSGVTAKSDDGRQSAVAQGSEKTPEKASPLELAIKPTEKSAGQATQGKTPVKDPAESVKGPQEPQAGGQDGVTSGSTAATAAAPTDAGSFSNVLNAQISGQPSGMVQGSHVAGQTAAPMPALPAEARFAEANHPPMVTGITTRLLPDGGTMTLRLDPPELGAMAVSVRVSGGQLTATLEAESADAVKLLTHSISSLRNSLEASGVSIDRIEVSHNQKLGQQSESKNSDGSGREGQPSAGRGGANDPQSRQNDRNRQAMLDKLWARVTGDPLNVVI